MDVMDAALEILEGAAPEYCGGMINHGPMVAEAMTTLGRPEAVIDWTRYYSRRLQKRGACSTTVTADTWRSMLGNKGFSEWFDFFKPIAASSSTGSFLREWVPRLAPGLSAAALHGIIRTGHALRSLAARDTPLRKTELASGLAYWASHYEVLPGRISGNREALPPAQAIRRIVPLRRGEQRPYGLIGEKMQALKNYVPFEKGLAILDTSSDLNRLISEFTEIFAGIYLSNSRDLSTATILMHTVTAPSALRPILPCLDRKDAENILNYMWQACAACYSAVGDGFKRRDARLTETGDLIDTAVNTGDEHAIKFTEACLREYALHPQPVYLRAARDAVERISYITEL
jgi:hypothetical protein